MAPTVGEGGDSSGSVGKGDGEEGELTRYVSLYLDRVDRSDCDSCVGWFNGTTTRPPDQVREGSWDGDNEAAVSWDPPPFMARVPLDALYGGLATGDIRRMAFGDYDASDLPDFSLFEWRDFDGAAMSYTASGDNLVQTRTMRFAVRAEQPQEVVITSYCGGPETVLVVDPARSAPDDYQTLELLPGENRVTLYAGTRLARDEPGQPSHLKNIGLGTTTWNLDSDECSWDLALHRVSGIPSDGQVTVQARYTLAALNGMIEGDESEGTDPVASGNGFEASWANAPLLLSGVHGTSGDVELEIKQQGSLWLWDTLTTCRINSADPSTVGPFTVQCSGSADPISIEVEFIP